MSITFELCRGVIHPDTPPADLHAVMLRIFDRMDQNVAAFMKEQGVRGIFTSKLIKHSANGDPICGLYLTIVDDAQAIYFKMWFEKENEAD